MSDSKPPPQGWETAGLLKAWEFSHDVKGKAWLRAEIARLPKGATLATPGDKGREMLALAVAQMRHWRERAARQDTRYAELLSHVNADLKSRLDADLLATAHRLVELHSASGKPLPEPAWYRQELNWSSDQAASRAGRYKWLDAEHRGPALRRVLCYEKSQFGRLVRKHRLCPRRSGREYVFTCRQALQLLTHRLKPRTKRSRDVAQRIWESATLRLVTRKTLPAEFAELRAILEQTCCPCAVAADGRPDLTEIDRRLEAAESKAVTADR